MCARGLTLHDERTCVQDGGPDGRALACGAWSCADSDGPTLDKLSLGRAMNSRCLLYFRIRMRLDYQAVYNGVRHLDVWRSGQLIEQAANIDGGTRRWNLSI